jgi:hypothetical protein
VGRDSTASGVASSPARDEIFALEESAPRVPREYRAFDTYLEHRYASVVVLTFEQIEALLGFALPTSARTEGSGPSPVENRVGRNAPANWLTTLLRYAA